jgi:hypothetical protein
MVHHDNDAMESTMTKREANQQQSLDAFLAQKAEFDALVAELQQMSADHFGATPRRCSGARSAA